MDTFREVTQKAAYGVAALGASALLTWSIWITQYTFALHRDILDREEVSAMINSQSPYVEDRRLINQTLIDTKQALSSVNNAINNNTTAITKLQTFLEKEVSHGQDY